MFKLNESGRAAIVEFFINHGLANIQTVEALAKAFIDVEANYDKGLGTWVRLDIPWNKSRNGESQHLILKSIHFDNVLPKSPKFCLK